MCKCSEKSCNNQADYLVLLTKYYEDTHQMFVEIDYTCPLLCEKHKQENEDKKKEDPNHIWSIDYPYSNKNDTTGMTKYIPLRKIINYLNKQ
ncbi:MAG: hypothetical protein IKN49_00910 [Elusimicrobiaceae bacterium]|nr:hypothetical protein [Elusimicrobiaceae bacterium]